MPDVCTFFSVHWPISSERNLSLLYSKESAKEKGWLVSKPLFEICQRILHSGFACSFVPLIEDGSEWRLIHVPYFVQEQNRWKRFRSYDVDEGKLKNGKFIGRKMKPKSHDRWCDGDNKFSLVVLEDGRLKGVDPVEGEIWKIVSRGEGGSLLEFNCLSDIPSKSIQPCTAGKVIDCSWNDIGQPTMEY